MKIGIALLLVVIASGCIFAKQPVTTTPTPTAEPTLAPVAEDGATNLETPNIQGGAPSDDIDLGSLV